MGIQTDSGEESRQRQIGAAAFFVQKVRRDALPRRHAPVKRPDERHSLPAYALQHPGAATGAFAPAQTWNAPHRSADNICREEVDAYHLQVRTHWRATRWISTWDLLPAPAFRPVSQTEKRLRSGEGRRGASTRLLARTLKWCERRVRGPRNISRERRERRESRHRGSGIDGVRNLAGEAALIRVRMMMAGWLLRQVSDAPGHDRTLDWRGEDTGLRGMAAFAWCENPHQERQQEYWKDRSNPAPQHLPPQLAAA